MPIGTDEYTRVEKWSVESDAVAEESPLREGAEGLHRDHARCLADSGRGENEGRDEARTADAAGLGDAYRLGLPASG